MAKEGRTPPKENICFKPLKIPLVFTLIQLADSGLMYTHKRTNGHTHWSGYSHQWKRDFKPFWKTESVQMCLWLKLSAVSCGPEHSPGLGGLNSVWDGLTFCRKNFELLSISEFTSAEICPFASFPGPSDAPRPGLSSNPCSLSTLSGGGYFKPLPSF